MSTREISAIPIPPPLHPARKPLSPSTSVPPHTHTHALRFTYSLYVCVVLLLQVIESMYLGLRLFNTKRM